MKPSSNRELLVGLFVLAGLVGLGYLATLSSSFPSTSKGGLTIFATFDNAGGLKPRSKVTIAGVKVGEVTAITLDEDYMARVELDIDRDLQLTTDSSASILTSGVLGDQYLSLQLGAEEEYLESGDSIEFTQSALILEKLIGALVHSTDLGGGE